jgi:hypothetical protein
MRFKGNVVNNGHNFEARPAKLKTAEYQNWIGRRQHAIAGSKNNREVAC